MEVAFLEFQWEPEIAPPLRQAAERAPEHCRKRMNGPKCAGDILRPAHTRSVGVHRSEVQFNERPGPFGP